MTMAKKSRAPPVREPVIQPILRDRDGGIAGSTSFENSLKAECDAAALVLWKSIDPVNRQQTAETEDDTRARN